MLGAFMLAAATLVTAAPSDSTVIVLSGTMTAADKGTYQEHPFDVPAGVTRIDVEFSYQNQQAGTELEIGIFDATRFRGTSRFSKSRFHIAEFEATPSYLPGPIGPGRWRISLGVPSIGATQITQWTATIRLSTKASPREGLGAGAPLKTEAGWYAGDLHAHTLHSDGYGCEDSVDGASSTTATAVKRGCQPWEVVEAARARHLDFIAITDHNTTSHHAELAVLQESLTSLLLVRGQELTTFHGHANVYGTSRIIDFRLGFQGRSMVDVMDDVRAQGGLLSINHPGRDTGDRCTGCGWDAPQTPWDRIEAMEVVNGGNIEGRTAGLPFWYARLNEGHRITAIGGGDEHAVRSARGRVGSPATVIYASELSEAAILDGIRSGRVYLRTRGPEGPALDLNAIGAGSDQKIAMGGILHLANANANANAKPAPLRFEIHASAAAGQKLEIVKNGEVVSTLDVASGDATLTYDATLAKMDWLHVRLRDAKGLTAFTNPVYVR